MRKKNIYDDIIKPRFDEIAEWIADGATEESVYKKLNISCSTWYRNKNEHEELKELIKQSREPCVDKLENSTYEAATGFYRTVVKHVKCKHVDYQDGKRLREYETLESVEEQIYFPPNMTAAIYLLKHWGKERGYTNDPATIELKKQELKLKQEIAENNNW